MNFALNQCYFKMCVCVLFFRSLLIRSLALVSVSREEEEDGKKNSRIIENHFVDVKTLSSRYSYCYLMSE